MTKKATPAQLIILRYLDQSGPQAFGRSRLSDMLSDYAAGDASNIDNFLERIEKDGFVKVLPRMVQGGVEPSYELRITTAGGIAVQSDKFGDIPRSERIAKKLEELAVLFREEQ